MAGRSGRGSSAEEEPESQGRKLRREVWQGAIPVRVVLDVTEVTSLTAPEPFFIMAPRNGYLPFLIKPMQHHFHQALPPGTDTPWFDFRGLPLKWHIPTGVLYDLLASSDPATVERPWNLTVHFRAFPSDSLLPCDSDEAVRFSYLNSLKEASHIAWGHTKNVMGLSQGDQNDLWTSVASASGDGFERITQKMMPHHHSRPNPSPAKATPPRSSAQSGAATSATASSIPTSPAAAPLSPSSLLQRLSVLTNPDAAPSSPSSATQAHTATPHWRRQCHDRCRRHCISPTPLPGIRILLTFTFLTAIACGVVQTSAQTEEGRTFPAVNAPATAVGQLADDPAATAAPVPVTGSQALGLDSSAGSATASVELRPVNAALGSTSDQSFVSRGGAQVLVIPEVDAAELVAEHTAAAFNSGQMEVETVVGFDNVAFGNLDEKDRTEEVAKSLRTNKVLARHRARLDWIRRSLKMPQGGWPAAEKGEPVGDIYHDAGHFRSTYRAMEKYLRIYVYRDGSHPLTHTSTCKDIYAIDGVMFNYLRPGMKYVTTDATKANLFFIPVSVVNMVNYLWEHERSFQAMIDFMAYYIGLISIKYDYWNRTGGADHFMLTCHDWGPYISQANSELAENSIRVLCNSKLGETAVEGKDLGLPEINIKTPGYLWDPKTLGGPPPEERFILAFFAGTSNGNTRPILFEHWKEKDRDIRIYEHIPEAISKNMSYDEHMKHSKFCICPAGFEVNSPRLVEAIYSDCVPVILADNFSLPFRETIDWTSFSIHLPEASIPDLKSILLAVPYDEYLAMQRRLAIVRKHFIVNDPPQPYDVFHMILHSLWRQRLFLHESGRI